MLQTDIPPAGAQDQTPIVDQVPDPHRPTQPLVLSPDPSIVLDLPIDVLSRLLPDFHFSLRALNGDLAVIRMCLSHLKDELKKGENDQKRFMPAHMSGNMLPKAEVLSEIEKAAEDAISCLNAIQVVYDSLKLGQCAGKLLEVLVSNRQSRRTGERVG